MTFSFTQALAFTLITTVGIIAVMGVRVKTTLESKGVTVTSWFRTPFKNERVGGVALSKHQFGLAMDCVPANEKTMAIMRQVGFKIVIHEGDHIHGELV